MRSSRRPAAGLVAVVACLAGAASAFAIAPPDDPLYPQQIAAGGALNLIHEPQALASIGSTPLADVLVSNFDTGLDLDHPDFLTRLATVPAGTPAPNSYGSPPPAPTVVSAGGSNGWDLLGTNVPGDSTLHPDADPTDPVGQTSHGTAVAGILGAAFNNRQGGIGVAPNARFLAMRTCWDDDDCYQSIQSDAANWAAARGVRVVSMSWLADRADYTSDFAPALHAASNTLFVAIPSGNGGATLADADRRPCGDPASNILCVTTSSPTDGLDCGDYNPTIVDLAVPTQNNITTSNGGGFSGATGCATSYAAPIAAGAAAVLFGLDPNATPQIVKQALIDSARPAAAWAGKSVSGGILDLDAAVRLFAQRRAITLTPDPPGTPTTPPGTTATTTTPATTTSTTTPIATPVRDTTAPTLSLKLDRTAFTAAKTATKAKPKPAGATLTATLSEAATLKLTIAKRTTGRRVGRRCLATTARTRRRPACTRLGPPSTLSFRGLKTGTVTLAFTGRTATGRALAAGTYQAVGVATDAAGNASGSRTITFTILR